MKSIQRRFKKILLRNPYWSSYISFCEAIRSQKFSKKTIAIWFNKLVEKDDYDSKERRDILRRLSVLSNLHEEGWFGGLNDSLDRSNSKVDKFYVPLERRQNRAKIYS
ncbi:MAG: hypothetical protein WC705_00080 [Candidatus Paceibacterota bacterium]|jgi:hypothetical protein